jgi:signal transduction histidine kinase
VAVWRALRHGGLDESTTDLPITPALAAFLPTCVTSLRWATVLFGMVYAEPRAIKGDLAVVGSLSLLLFLASWRSWRPLKLGSRDGLDRTVAVSDAIIAGVAAGLSGGLLSPFAPAVVVVPPLAAFGWGIIEAIAALAGLLGGILAGQALSHHHIHVGGTGWWWVAIAAVALTLAALGARRAAMAAEVRRATLSGQVETLTDANDLLSVLARVARTLPNAYNLQDALDRVELQLTETFRPQTILFVSPTGDEATWRTEISLGMDCPSLVSTTDLPPPLRHLLTDTEDAALPAVMTVALRARGELVGLLMLAGDHEHPYVERQRRLLSGLADVMALTIDNGRLFGRLRSFGAETERNRIARDLHDRLGQWLTYIGLELERMMRHERGSVSDDIDRLHHDVQSAMAELRETLRDLRTSISPERGFDVVAVEVLDRFRERTGVTTEVEIATPGVRLDLESEHEILRILQEALHNIDKHAQASTVDVTWSVGDDGARLVVIDDGQGFDDALRRNGSFGLIGMRERAVGIGATLEIQSRPGAGTTVVVETMMERAK